MSRKGPVDGDGMLDFMEDYVITIMFLMSGDLTGLCLFMNTP